MRGLLRHTRAFTRAFTLIELLVVIVILGVLMAVALPTYLRQQSKAKDSNAKSQLTYAYRAIRSSLPEFGNVYPATASIVSAISQSEPELTVASGNCTASTDDKHVTVDPVLTTSTKLALYTKSSSGTWWRLTAGVSGAQTFTPLGTCLGGLSTAAATVSGNEITDTTRAAKTQGDDLSNDSSYGIWEASTNLLTNGGFENGTAGWVASQVGGGDVALSRDTSTSVFGGASLKLTASTGTLNAARYQITLATSTTYSLSGWVRVVGVGSGSTGLVLTTVYNSPQTNINLPVTLSVGDWRYFSGTFTTDSSVQTADYVDLRLSGALTSQYTINLDGVQLEQKGVATPYIETNGSTATRNAARVQVPAAMLTPSQGWVAIRVRYGYASTVPISNFASPPRLWSWYQNGNNRIDLRVGNGGSLSFSWVMGGTGNAGDPAGMLPNWTHSAGGAETVIIAWTPTKLYASRQGGGFTSVPVTAAATVISVPIDIGTNSGSTAFDGDVVWFACGTGTLSDSDAATINAWGDTDPTSQDFPAAAQAKLAWSADTANYVTGN